MSVGSVNRVKVEHMAVIQHAKRAQPAVEMCKGVLAGGAECYPPARREEVPFRVVHIVVTIQTPTEAESTVRSREFAQAFADALEVNGEGRVAAGVRAALAYKPGSKLVKVANTEATGVGFAARIVAGHTDTPETWDRITAISEHETELSELEPALRERWA